MFIQRSVQLISALFFVALLSGCVSSNPQSSTALGGCKWDRESCMHEGSYEPGEREYAEAEAKDLNKAAAKKVRRRTGWW